jgi:hypothetical protein
MHTSRRFQALALADHLVELLFSEIEIQSDGLVEGRHHTRVGFKMLSEARID